MTSRPRALAGAAAQPRGMRRPRPGLPLALLRALIFTALGLTLLREPLTHLAAELARSPERRADTSEQLDLPAPPEPALLGALLLEAALHEELRPLLSLTALAGLLGMAAELLFAGAALALQDRAARSGREGIYLRVLLPRNTGAPGAGASAKPDPELFRVLAGGLSSRGRLLGQAPWCTFVLGAAPDEPAELGVYVAGSARQRERFVALLHGTIGGLSPGAVVEPEADPLLGANTVGGHVAWREYGLALPPEYPLRQLDGATASDLLGPLTTAIGPRDARYVELQLAVRPFGGVAGWALNRGWRGRATALKLLLEQKGDYALAPDVTALESKLAGAPFEVTIRVVAVADTPTGASAALDRVGDALGAYQARTATRLQRLTPLRSGQGKGGSMLLRAPRFAPPPHFLLPIRPWRDPDILTPPELAGLWHLPTPALGSLVRWLGARRIAAPPHAFVDPAAPGKRIVVGHARRADGRVAPVGPTLRDLRQVLHLTAGMGAGKSRLLANLCAQFMPYGFTLIDGKGDDVGSSLITTVRRLIPPADEGRLVILDALDGAWPVGLNPLAGVEVARPGGADLALGQVLALFARLDPETWSRAPGMSQFAQMATLLVLEGEPRPTLAHVKQALLDERYRERLLPRVTNAEVADFWRVTFPRLGEGQRSSRDALLRRLDALLTNETTRHLVTQAEPTFDFATAIEDGMIVLVPVPDMTLGGLAGPIAMLIFQAFVRAAFARGGSDSSRASYPLVVDELQVLTGGASADLEVAMTRLRSLGIPAVYAHQALAQLGDLTDLMTLNAANRIILQTGEPDASAYAKMYAASGITAADIAQQEPNSHQYAVLRCEGAPAGPFSVRPLPWPAPAALEAPTYDGPDWRVVRPVPGDPLDRVLLRIAYGSVAEGPALAELAALDEADWSRLLARWDTIRHAQRGHILEHPGCIPDQLERQRWLSRLLVARPRLLAAAEYARARRS
jgi:hypothetical protein